MELDPEKLIAAYRYMRDSDLQLDAIVRKQIQRKWRKTHPNTRLISIEREGQWYLDDRKGQLLYCCTVRIHYKPAQLPKTSEIQEHTLPV